jgi:hypothetical protein
MPIDLGATGKSPMAPAGWQQSMAYQLSFTEAAIIQACEK